VRATGIHGFHGYPWNPWIPTKSFGFRRQSQNTSKRPFANARGASCAGGIMCGSQSTHHTTPPKTEFLITAMVMMPGAPDRLLAWDFGTSCVGVRSDACIRVEIYYRMIRMIWGHTCGFPSIWNSKPCTSTKHETAHTNSPRPQTARILLNCFRALLAQIFANPQLRPLIIRSPPSQPVQLDPIN
jgi:hypothetical protein